MTASLDIRELVSARLEDEIEAAWRRRDFPQAVTGLGELLAQRAASFGETAVQVVDTLCELAEAERAAGLGDARATLERALAYEAERGPSPRRARVKNRLGALLAEAGELQAALPFLSAAAREADPNEQAAAMGSWASALAALGRFAEAAQVLAGIVVAPCERTRLLDERARLHQAMGAKDRALELAEAAALACDPSSTPALDAASAHAFAAELLEVRGELQRALGFYRAAYEFYGLAIRAPHPQLGVALLNIAVLEERMGMGATATATSALEMFEQTLGPAHEQTLAARRVLGLQGPSPHLCYS